MSKCRLPLLFVCTLLAFATIASAQDCATYCDPYFSSCSDYCQRCTREGIDGCIEWADSSCAGRFGNGPCIPDSCTPNWQETSRVTQGTYDGVSWNSCNHHLVQWVTLVDQNSCNQNSNYYTYHYCDDVIDDWKNGGFYPSCCNGYGENGTYLTCNGYHSCTG
jgi:hypothetical protein